MYIKRNYKDDIFWYFKLYVVKLKIIDFYYILICIRKRLYFVN